MSDLRRIPKAIDRIVVLQKVVYYGEYMEAREAHERHSNIARGNIRDFYDPETGQILPMNQWTPEMGQRVKKCKTVVRNVAAGDGHTDTIHELECYDAQRAQETIGRWTGMEEPKPDVTIELRLVAQLQAGRKFLAKSAGRIKQFQDAARAKRAIIEGEIVETENSETG